MIEWQDALDEARKRIAAVNDLSELKMSLMKLTDWIGALEQRLQLHENRGFH